MREMASGMAGGAHRLQALRGDMVVAGSADEVRLTPLSQACAAAPTPPPPDPSASFRRPPPPPQQEETTCDGCSLRQLLSWCFLCFCTLGRCTALPSHTGQPDQTRPCACCKPPAIAATSTPES